MNNLKQLESCRSLLQYTTFLQKRKRNTIFSVFLLKRKKATTTLFGLKYNICGYIGKEKREMHIFAYAIVQKNCFFIARLAVLCDI